MPGFINCDEPQGANASESIVADVHERAASRNRHQLMTFIDDRGQHDKSHRAHPRLDDAGLVVAETAIRKQRKNEVFANVAQLPNYSVQKLDSLRAQPRKQEPQQRHNIARGLTAGKRVGREQIDCRNPEEQRKPIFENECSIVSNQYCRILMTTSCSNVMNWARMPRWK